MQTRTEVDSLGEKKVPKDAYYGIQTLRAVENFPVSGIRAPTIFIQAYVMVKKAAATANMQVGWLDQAIGNAIIKACDEALNGRFVDQFVVDIFQAGAGTSFNMNVNEVLSNRALELLGEEKGNYKTVSPNDHVNMAQSSNDTFPTALHISTLMTMQPLMTELERLADGKGRRLLLVLGFVLVLAEHGSGENGEAENHGFDFSIIALHLQKPPHHLEIILL